jgi:hypothetical protein
LLVVQGSVEALQSAVANLAAHVALRTRAANPEVATAAAAAGVESGDLPELNTLEQLEPECESCPALAGGVSCVTGQLLLHIAAAYCADVLLTSCSTAEFLLHHCCITAESLLNHC